MSWKIGVTRIHFTEIRKNKFRKKIFGRALCGINPIRKGTDDKKFVTCKRCLKILEKNG